VLEHATAIARALHRHADSLATPQASGAALELSAELEQQSAKWVGLGQELLDLCEAGQRDWVYWRSSGQGGVRLHGVPVSAGDYARRLVARARTVVITSATLTAGGDFRFTAGRLGLGEEWGMPYETTLQPSPFDLAAQTRTFVLDAQGREEDVVSDAVTALARATGRSQLVLFTAHDRLRRARERLLARLDSEVPLYAQEWDGSVSQLSERFRSRRGAILLGVQSLWEGVDFPGTELEIVVVAKLPFSVPDDPRVEARGERLREDGLDPFRADAVPEAVLRFRQGVGRLIRRADDRGVLVVCDPRLVSASYRAPFLEALPAPPEVCSGAGELAGRAAAFFAASTGDSREEGA
jgi:Rad3-related DNA helicase